MLDACFLEIQIVLIYPFIAKSTGEVNHKSVIIIQDTNQRFCRWYNLDMKSPPSLSKLLQRFFPVLAITLLLQFLPQSSSRYGTVRAAEIDETPQETYCEPPQSLTVATSLNDLAGNEYVRMDGQHTGFTGGLYPGGSNVRPAQHQAAGVAIARQIQPLDASGNPDPVNGKIVMVSIGMSNASTEFIDFKSAALADPSLDPHVSIINGAQPMQTAEAWLDPTAEPWVNLNTRLSNNQLTPAQVQTAWVKQTRLDLEAGEWPTFTLNLKDNLVTIVHNLKTLYPNIKIVYFSSRTYSFTYWYGLNPEPMAYETGFSVKWLIESQINGDPALNFDPVNGPVTSPYLTWSAYLWANGEHPRSDGLVWEPQDMVGDCVHPSTFGRAKVLNLLMSFFKTDPTANWLWSSPLYLPSLLR